MMHKAWNDIEEVPYGFSRSSVQFQGHTGQKIAIFTRVENFRTVALVLIHRWPRNNAHSLKWHRGGALLFFKAIRQISMSQGFEFMDCYEKTHIGCSSMEEVSFCYSRSSVKFQVHAGWQITFDHVWDCKSVCSYQIPQICLVIWYSFENQIILAASQCNDTATTLYIKIILCTHFANPIRMELKFSRAFYEIKFDWWCTVIYTGTVDNIILSNIR